MRFRLFEHEYEVPVEPEDKRIAVTTVMRSLRNFFRTETLRERSRSAAPRWLALEDLVSFHVGDVACSSAWTWPSATGTAAS